jgi:hypothetical protein
MTLEIKVLAVDRQSNFVGIHKLFSTEADYFQDTKQHYNYIRLQRFLFLAHKDIYILWLMIYFGLKEGFPRNSASAH